MTPNPHAAGLLPLLDERWRRKLFAAGLILCIPVVGWPAVLGYRSRTARRLFTAAPSPLPEWREGFAGFLFDGVKAMAVIFGYLSPLTVVLGLTAAARGYGPGAADLSIAAAMVAFPIFSTLAFPLACILLAGGARPWISSGECAALLAAFALILFAIPAGFLEVSKTGRYRSAFAVWRTLPFIGRNFTSYCRAWLHSGVASLCAHFALPIAPFAVAWCYVAIIVLFNELLLRDGGAPGTGWLAHALADPRLRPPRGCGTRAIADAAGRPVRVLDTPWFSAPLPWQKARAAAPAGPE